LTPKRNDSSAVDQPSTSWNDYEAVPPLREDLVRRLKSVKDLVLG
jgi:hypothetical protein